MLFRRIDVTEYIMLILGCVVCETMVDIILPSGRMQSFVKSIVGVFIFAVLLMPILNLIKQI